MKICVKNGLILLWLMSFHKFLKIYFDLLIYIVKALLDLSINLANNIKNWKKNKIAFSCLNLSYKHVQKL